MLVNPISFRLSVSFFWKSTWSLYKYDTYKFLFFSDIVFLSYFLFFFRKFLKSKKTDYYISHLRLYRIKKNVIINLFYYNPTAEMVFKQLKDKFWQNTKKIKNNIVKKKNEMNLRSLTFSMSKFASQRAKLIEKKNFWKKLRSKFFSKRMRARWIMYRNITSVSRHFFFRHKKKQMWNKKYKIEMLKEKYLKKYNNLIITSILEKKLTKRKLTLIKRAFDWFWRYELVKIPFLYKKKKYLLKSKNKYKYLTKKQTKDFKIKQEKRKALLRHFHLKIRKRRSKWRKAAIIIDKVLQRTKKEKKKHIKIIIAYKKLKKFKNSRKFKKIKKKKKIKVLKRLKRLKKFQNYQNKRVSKAINSLKKIKKAKKKPFYYIKIKIKKKKIRKKFIILKLLRLKNFIKNKKSKKNLLLYNNKSIKNIKKKKKQYNIFKNLIKRLWKKTGLKKIWKKKKKKKIQEKEKKKLIKKIKKIYNKKMKKIYKRKKVRINKKNKLIFLIKISYCKLIFNYRFLLYNLYIYILSKILKKEIKTLFFNQYKNFRINLYLLTIGQVSAKVIAKYLKTKLEKNYTISKTINPVIVDLSKRAVFKQIKGFKFMITGRFKRASRATFLWRQRGGFGIGTITAALDYAVVLLKTKYGVCAIKVWIRGGRKFRYFKKDFPIFKIFFFQEKKKYFLLKKNELFFNYLLKRFYLAYSKFNIKYIKNILLNLISKYLYVNIFLKKLILKKKLKKKKKILKKKEKKKKKEIKIWKTTKKRKKKKIKWKWKKNIKFILLPQYCLYKIFIKDFIKFNYLKIKPFINLKLLKRLNIRRSYKLKIIAKRIKPLTNINYKIKMK